VKNYERGQGRKRDRKEIGRRRRGEDKVKKIDIQNGSNNENAQHWEI
jgi:hypothetical protein